MTAAGTFEVEITPESSEEADGSTLGRMALGKRFQGDLEGTGEGVMLTAVSPVEGSAGYVALERVTGTLQGRPGGFILQHSGTMSGGEQALSIGIVPDTGTGDLEGIAGTMEITVEDGVHRYALDYTLP